MGDILNIGTSALNAYQRALNITGHNVANVNTPGYSRQRAEAVAQEPDFIQGSYVGTGVKNSDIERVYDEFLAAQLRASQSTTSDLAAYYKIASQMDKVVADPDTGLDPAMQDFFDALQGLADDPGSTPVRELLLAESEAMVDRFHYLGRILDDTGRRTEADMVNIVEDINGLAETIAELNRTISTAPGIRQGHWPNDLLDQRDQAVNELTKYINVTTLDQDDGTLTVYFGKGQPLVLGLSYKSLSVVDSPDIPQRREIAYVNDQLVDVISDQITGGQLGGLLRARDEVVAAGKNRLGLVALGLSFEINAQHREGLNLFDQTGLDFFTDLSLSQSRGSALNPPATDYLFDITVTDPSKLPASDFSLVYNGGAANDFSSYSLIGLADNQALTPTPPPPGFPWDLSADLGISIDLNTGTSIAAGDRFFFSPTANAANLIGLEIRDTRAIAAASPIEILPAAANAGSGAIGLPAIEQVSSLPVQLAGPVTLTFSNDLDGLPATNDPGFVVAGGPGGTLAYDPAAQGSGQTFRLDMGGYFLSFTASGQPAAGDVFTLDNGTTARVSDNRNATLMGDLQQWRGMLDGRANLQDTFGNYVAQLGSRTRQASINMQAQESMLEMNKDALESVKGVNLDEEAANLIRFQQAYQAAAQIISTASSLFDSLISAVR